MPEHCALGRHTFGQHDNCIDLALASHHYACLSNSLCLIREPEKFLNLQQLLNAGHIGSPLVSLAVLGSVPARSQFYITAKSYKII
jgi:hypothetical protein